MKIISICNQKGGSGKTTTAINLSAALSLSSKRVLLVDFDPQAHATMGLNIEAKNCIYDAISNRSKNRCNINKVIIKLNEKLHFIPSSIILSTLEQELSDDIARESRLRDTLNTISDNYDYVLIDCPPNLGLLTINALCASDSALVPVEASRFSVDGVSRLVEIIELIGDRLNHKVEYRVLVTIFDSRLRHSFDILKRIKDTFGQKVFSTIIHVNVKLKESQAYGMPVLSYDKYSRGSKDYFTLSREIITNKEYIDTDTTVTMEKISQKMNDLVIENVKNFIDVNFNLYSPDARAVFIVGDFNNWQVNFESLLENNNGTWRKKFPLERGTYQYKFVVDGKWLEDPANPNVVKNQYGELNSLIEVK